MSGGTVTLRGGTLALPPDANHPEVWLAEGDLQIVDGEITAIGAVKQDRGEVIDARHLLVIPGLIDPQVHFRDPGFPHKEDLGSGSRAAAAGGVTAFLEMPNTDPPTTSRARLDDKLATAAAKSSVDFGFFIGATPDNLDELLGIDQAPDVCGIKIFMGSSTGSLLVDDRVALDRIFGHGNKLIAVHAEDEARLRARKAAFQGETDVAKHSEIRDAEAARLASSLALELSEKYQRRLHILHLSTKDEVELLRAHGKGQGRVTAEVTPQHLLLTAPEIYQRLGTKAQMNPPLRSAEHAAALWSGLKDGTLDLIATDHAPHTLEEKAKGFGAAPSGMPGVETSLAAMLDAAHRGLCTVEQVVRWMSHAPAKAYRIEKKGDLRVGYDGDFALVDLHKVRRVEDQKIQSRVGWNPFEGVPLQGWPIATFLRGTSVYRDREIQPAVRGKPLRFTAPSRS
ncbi:MAG: dihydroorotase [Myxococcota bacterium]